MDVTPSKIVVQGVTYVPENSVVEGGVKKILVLPRGWVIIGDVSENKETGLVEVRNASTIRRWGTTTGLGELVNGPTKNTVLDKIPGLVEVHPLNIIQRITVNASKW